MSASKAIQHLAHCIQQLQSAVLWLERSLAQSKSIDISTPLHDEDLDKLENLTSRFARVTDILINKVYRALDSVELAEPGSLIDTINRAAKRNLIDSVEMARKLKDIRNEIAHEYVVANLQLLFTEVLTHAQILITLADKACQYCAKYTQS